jgi:hypothetical protein
MKYQFQETGNKELDKIIKKFDKQIKAEYKSADGDKYRCLSYWSKNIFLESINFDLRDWKLIRTKDYWQKRDDLQRRLNNLKSEDIKQKEEIKLHIKKMLYNSILKYKKVVY